MGCGTEIGILVACEVDEEATIRTLGDVYKGQVIVGRDLLAITPGTAAPAN
ncbi:MAG: hypothetical protein WCO56_23630 [Verrucomicrobiota bacterium]